MPPLLEARDLRKTFSSSPNALTKAAQSRAAVDGVSLRIEKGETLAIVGESGSGKTTLARMLLRLIEPDAGEIQFEEKDLLKLRGAELRNVRARMQMIFQDPFSSLDPRMRVAALIAEPLEIHDPDLTRSQRVERVREALAAVGLDESSASRFPHEFSGGQRQRIGIARALILRPSLVIADEPVSALDVSIGAQIIELLARLQRELALTLLIISHSLPVVGQLANRIAVMREGRFVEEGSAAQILDHPQHPYTKAFLDAVPEVPA